MSAVGSLRLIVTRPAAQSAAAVSQWRARGVDAVPVPLIEIVAVADDTRIASAWASLASLRMAVFVSANAVLRFFASRPAGAAWPTATLAAAPGPGTADALRAEGVASALIVEPLADAAQFDSEALWQRLRERDWRGAGVIVVRGGTGREWLGDRLAEAGADVHVLAAYERAVPVLAVDALRIVEESLSAPAQHVWLFSSSEAIGNLEQVVGSGRWLRSRAIATHPRIAERARQAGFVEVLEVAPGVEAVIACIQSMRP